jgi:hypothetical protein
VEEVHDSEEDLEAIHIPPLLALEDLIEIYTTEVYKYCGFNLKHTCKILDISEKQLVSLLENHDSRLDFS